MAGKVSVMATAGPQAVGILGGMGPAAGADFVRLFVQACTAQMEARGIAVRDQAYPEHWLAQLPIPDRSTALQDPRPGHDLPGEALLQALGRLAALGVRTVAMACNTAHAWHGLLQQRFPQVQVLHGVREVAQVLAAGRHRQVGLLATRGTYNSGLYQQALQARGLECCVPLEAEQALLMQGIYDGVKAGNLALARQCFETVARALQQRHGLDAVVMGCTEIPLALDQGMDGLALLNPTQILAEALAREAYAPAALAAA